MFVLPGQYYDVETGLHQNGWRDYDPSTGRYLEADPIGVTKDYSNLDGFGSRRSTFDYALNHNYAYTDGNPVNNIDFSGLYVNGFKRFDVRALITNPNSMGLIPNPNPGGSSSSCPIVVAGGVMPTEYCDVNPCSAGCEWRDKELGRDCSVTTPPTDDLSFCTNYRREDKKTHKICIDPNAPAVCLNNDRTSPRCTD